MACRLSTLRSQGESEIELERPFISGTCGLLPICQRQTLVNTQGLVWNLRNQSLNFGGVVSNSNRIDNDEPRPRLFVRASAPVVFTFELAKPNVML